MKKFLTQVVLSIAGLSAEAHAAEWTEWADTSADFPSFIYTRDEGIIFELPNVTRNTSVPDCAHKFILPVTSQNYEMKAQNLLSAYFSERPMKVRVSFDKELSNKCWGTVQWIAVERAR